jgi:hypothetical protein
VICTTAEVVEHFSDCFPAKLPGKTRVQESKAETKARIRITFTCSVTNIALTEEISKH